MIIKENYHQLIVGDVPLGFVTDIPFHDTPPEYFFDPTDTKPEVFLFMMRRDRPGLGFVDYPNKLWLGMDEDGIEKYRFQGFYLRMLGALLAGAHSKELNAVHGGGCYIAPIEKGVLFLGPGESGKTTITRIFDDRPDRAWDQSKRFDMGRTLDDDVLFIDNYLMYTVGKVSGMTYQDDKGKTIDFRPAATTMETLDGIFYLDRSLKAGKFQQMPGEISRDLLAFDSLPPEILKPILDLPPYQAKAPVFRLGTDGDVRDTIQTIEKAFYSVGMSR
jgi:hypothetical protein